MISDLKLRSPKTIRIVTRYRSDRVNVSSAASGGSFVHVEDRGPFSFGIFLTYLNQRSLESSQRQKRIDIHNYGG